MKRDFCLLFVCLFSVTCWATHNRAGDITYRQIGALSYEATVTTYTKVSSISADRDSLEICWGDGFCEFVARSNGNGNGVLLMNDIKKNEYIGTHTYPNQSTYIVSMTDPNRNGGILNINPPQSDQVPFHIEAMINIPNAQFMGMNNSPIFLFPPVDVGYVNQPFVHCANHKDEEGDSLAYELIVPLQGIGVPVTNYSFPNTLGPQPQSLSINPHTGMLTWISPPISGEYVVAILLKEYRNGTLIGSIMRDMLITIEPTLNRLPTFTDTTAASYVVSANTTIQFTVNATDSDNDSLKIAATGFPLDINATFTAPLGNVKDSIAGAFSWMPTLSDVRDQPYQMAFRVEDDADGTFGGVSYKVVRLKVTPFVSTERVESANIFQLFPNPTTDYVMIDFKQTLSIRSSYKIFTNTGQLIKEGVLEKGEQLVKVDTSNIANGSYFLVIQQEGRVETRQLVIVR